jgi:hypothetical protein
MDTCLHEKRKAKAVEIRTHTHRYMEIPLAKLSFLL